MRYLLVAILLMPMHILAMSTAEKNEFLANEDWIFNSASLDDNPPYKLKFSITKRAFLKLSSVVNPFSNAKKEDVLANLRLYKLDENNNYVLENSWNNVLVRGKGHGSYAPICEYVDRDEQNNLIQRNTFNKTSLKVSFKKSSSIPETISKAERCEVMADWDSNFSLQDCMDDAYYSFPNAPASRFYGLKKLTLNGMRQDPSAIREVVGYDLFRDVGLQSLRTGYASVSIELIGSDPGDTSSPANCETYEERDSFGDCKRKENICHLADPALNSEIQMGIYLNLETYNDDYVVANNLNGSIQHIYESDYSIGEEFKQSVDMPEDLQEVFASIFSSDVSSLRGINAYGLDYCSEDEDHGGAGEQRTDLNDLKNKLSKVNYKDVGFWSGREGLNPGLDVDYVVRYMAVDAYSNNWDGFSYANNNYYLMSDLNGRFKILPSGLDQVLPGGGDGFLGWSGSFLFDKCGGNDFCKNKVLKEIQYIDSVVGQLDSGGRSLYDYKVSELRSKLNPYLSADPFLTNQMPLDNIRRHYVADWFMMSVNNQQSLVQEFFNERSLWLSDFVTENMASDLDSDEIPDSQDAFPSVSISTYRDLNLDDDDDDDGAPAVCDSACLALGMKADNCPSVANPLQVDSDLDGSGNACDKDLNNDGVVNGWDWTVLNAQSLGVYFMLEGRVNGFKAFPQSEY